MSESKEGTKNDAGKIRVELISPALIFAVGSVLTFGAIKYEDNNWAKGIFYSRVFGALMRHLWMWWWTGEPDEETGVSHLWHAACCIMFLIHYEQHPAIYREYDDRYYPGQVQ